ncbi:HNH endonuclease [Vibrio cyclitrophicus]|uniref:HNH endonuclease n=1 Tax=Vibrio cyclitrophicus TaxID=47951 RepID=UPI0002DA9F6A|nr:HNH endonuclease signature motif containing protein [Vibrio cyclitrophicus]ERM57994.1 HNH endonuclease [Vibrio cyclitrophicus FF75]OEE47101.1 hypothetical protein OAG_14515 [Vibrio cyclitrophicus FF75]
MSKLQEAKDFILDNCLLAALDSTELSERNRNIAKSQISWVNNFKTIGDLYRYLSVATSKSHDHVEEIQQLGRHTYESLLPEFEKIFAPWLHERTLLSDFVLNQSYPARDLLSAIGKFDTRCGGIQLHKIEGEVKEIVIKATLNNGKYPNQWLSDDKLLKYYLKSVKRNDVETFKVEYEDNNAIIHSGDKPIYTFVRNTDSGPFTFKGIFKYLGHVTDSDGKMWFQLAKADSNEAMFDNNFQASFEEQVQQSLEDSSAERRKRLKKAAKNPKPRKRVVSTVIYDRNPDVVAEVLERANGYCEAEKCRNPKAPFVRRKDGTPYLEVHHKIRLADGGDDTVENAVALCPNCHRYAHYGKS